MAGRKTKTVLEGDLRKLLRDDARFPSGTVTFCEWAPGGDPGMPDSWVACHGRWEPLELKRGSSVVKELRPAQRLWHRTSLKLGIPTHGLTIEHTGGRVLVFRLILNERVLEEVLLEEVDSNSLQLDVLTQIIMIPQ